MGGLHVTFLSSEPLQGGRAAGWGIPAAKPLTPGGPHTLPPGSALAASPPQNQTDSGPEPAPLLSSGTRDQDFLDQRSGVSPQGCIPAQSTRQELVWVGWMEALQ